MMQYELDFEKQLIELLTTGNIDIQIPEGHYDFNHPYKTRLWEYRPDIKTTYQLEQNFKEILEKLNTSTLDKPLSENEFKQVMNQIEKLSTPYQAAKFLYGENGISNVMVKLDDGRTVFLKVFDQAEIGAGDTFYQVVNQIERPPVFQGYPSRRFDVTLLINGLPLIQIELKNPDIDANAALEQMKKYAQERQYTGIFSVVQILVGMTPINTKYMAAATPETFNTDFSFYWKTAENRNIRDWKDFAKHVLSIPAAHLLATNYMVIDGTANRESIKVMRPYQVKATGDVLNAIERTDFTLGLNKDGYIWHTTGSGKTITSYKTAALASKSPNVDKVIFLVDRKTLTRQTLEAYRAYDPETVDKGKDGRSAILDTRSTRDLRQKLNSPSSRIIVTSTQKMKKLVRSKDFKPKDQKYVFIVDEAHRSTGTENFKDIQSAFPSSAWIGYSGTPVFEESKKEYRTVDIFGELLDAYTIREAIEDKNVLPFNVSFNKTVPDEIKLENLRNYYREIHPDWPNEKIEELIDDMTPDKMDESVRRNFYDNNPKHVEAVVGDIVDNWQNRSGNWRYNAILTTHVDGQGASVPMALMYYKEFKRRNEILRRYNLPELKVAISISNDDSNSESVHQIRDGLMEAIADYNAMFHCNFGIDDVDAYNEDIEDRLAKLSDDGNYLDLVIVVDRLLTGFNAPQLNTLYVDRVLQGRSLIQAYSRTNRVYDQHTKPFGNIVNYRWPEYSERLMNEALAVYSNRDSANLTPAEQKEKNKEENIILPDYHDLAEKVKDTVETIRNLTNGFENVPYDVDKQKYLMQQMREFNRKINMLKQYPYKENEDGTHEGFDYKRPELLYEDLGITELEGKTIQVSLMNELKRKLAENLGVPISMVDLRVEQIKEVTVDYDYLTKLFEDLMNEVHDDQMAQAEKTREKIVTFADTMDDRAYASQVIQASQAIYEREWPTKDSEIRYPYQLNSTKDLLRSVGQAQIAYVDKKLLTFIDKWGLSGITDCSVLRGVMANHQFGKADLDKTGYISNLLKNGAKQYKEKSNNKIVSQYSKLKYRNELREALNRLADEIVRES